MVILILTILGPSVTVIISNKKLAQYEEFLTARLMRQYHYQLGGLKIASELKLHQLEQTICGGSSQKTDVNIVIVDHPPATTQSMQSINNWMCGDKDAIHFVIEGLAQFLIIAGKQIQIYVEPNAELSEVELFLTGTAMGVVYHQRAIHPMHAACMARGNKAIALSGDTGEGKTTLAYAMMKRGHALITDDIAPIAVQEKDFYVYNEKPVLKMWRTTADFFGVSVAGMQSITNRHNKFYLPVVKSEFTTHRLDALVILASDEDCSEPYLSKLSLLQSLAALRQHTYRSFLVPVLWGEENFLAHSLAIVQAIPILRLTRPRSLSQLGKAVDLLEELYQH